MKSFLCKVCGKEIIAQDNQQTAICRFCGSPETVPAEQPMQPATAQPAVQPTAQTAVQPTAQSAVQQFMMPQQVQVTTSVNYEAYLKRAFLFLEDSDWENANAYCEKVLDVDPENANAYIVKLCIELRIPGKDQLKSSPQPFNNSNNYRKIIRFGDEAMKAELEECNTFIIKRNAYYAARRIEAENTESSFRKAAELYGNASGFEDADERAKECFNRAENIRKAIIYNRATELMNTNAVQTVLNARELYQSISGFNNADELAEKCAELAYSIPKDTAYNKAEALLKTNDLTNIREAYGLYLSIPQWKDADEKAKVCAELMDTMPKEAAYNRANALVDTRILGNVEEARRLYISIKGYKDSDAKAEECSRLTELIPKEEKYNKAEALFNSGVSENILAAREIYLTLPHFNDSDEKAAICEAKAEEARKNAVYNNAIALANTSVPANLEKAGKMFLSISGWKDADEKARICSQIAEQMQKDFIYGNAMNLFNTRDVTNIGRAKDIFEDLRGWRDSEQMVHSCEARISEIEEEIEAARIAQENKKKKTKRLLIAAVCALFIIAAVVVIGIISSQRDTSNESSVKDGESDREDEKYDSTDSDGENDHTVREEAIAAVSAGDDHTVGLKKDGTVVAVGDNEDGQCEVEDWSDIAAVSAGVNYTVGLKKDGTVVAVGDNDHGQCEVEDWSDIEAVSAGAYHTVGLKKDGTVVAVGDNEDGQCEVEDWSDIAAVSAGWDHTVGLKKDGTVVAVGWNEYGQCEVEDWSDIAAVSAGVWHTVGLKKDGTMVAVGNNGDVECEVEDWSDIAAVSAGDYHTVGLKKDGTVVAAGNNGAGECEVEDWN